ncbi:UNVERIFIED_CONTAM: hypothetical protein FKN15_061133 [Acipenser sinensis]
MTSTCLPFHNVHLVLQHDIAPEHHLYDNVYLNVIGVNRRPTAEGRPAETSPSHTKQPGIQEPSENQSAAKEQHTSPMETGLHTERSRMDSGAIIQTDQRDSALHSLAGTPRTTPLHATHTDPDRRGHRRQRLLTNLEQTETQQRHTPQQSKMDKSGQNISNTYIKESKLKPSHHNKNKLGIN